MACFPVLERQHGPASALGRDSCLAAALGRDSRPAAALGRDSRLVAALGRDSHGVEVPVVVILPAIAAAAAS